MAKSREQVTASAPKYADGKGSVGRLESINIEPTDNGGFIVSESRRSKAKSGDYPSYQPPSRNAFGDAKSAIEYVEKCLGHKD